MANARKRARQRRRAKSLIGSMREFLTPAVFKQVRNASARRKSPRWDLHPLLYVLLLTTYCCGDSLPEKFEAAKGFYVVCCPKRRRPGASFSGFEKAVAKLPMPVLRALAVAIRGRVETLFGERWKAAYVGYEVTAAMMSANVSFLIRMSSNATFYSEGNEPLDKFREGIVYYWPKTQQNEGKPPICGRLMRIHSCRHKLKDFSCTTGPSRATHPKAESRMASPQRPQATTPACLAEADRRT